MQKFCQTSPPVRWRGFTLIELMTVVLLVGILVAIALPIYDNYRNKIWSAQAVAEISAMSLRIHVYEQDARAYPADLGVVQLAGKLDPWGRPYVYYNIADNGRGHARKDHALNPINTDFDLYSAGPDGKTKPQISQKDSLDDIIRASNGQFVGIAADF